MRLRPEAEACPVNSLRGAFTSVLASVAGACRIYAMDGEARFGQRERGFTAHFCCCPYVSRGYFSTTF